MNRPSRPIVVPGSLPGAGTWTLICDGSSAAPASAGEDEEQRQRPQQGSGTTEEADTRRNGHGCSRRVVLTRRSPRPRAAYGWCIGAAKGVLDRRRPPRRRSPRAAATLGRRGTWRSLVAHVLWEHAVVGSNPTVPTDRSRTVEQAGQRARVEHVHGRGRGRGGRCARRSTASSPARGVRVARADDAARRPRSPGARWRPTGRAGWGGRSPPARRRSRARPRWCARGRARSPAGARSAGRSGG